MKDIDQIKQIGKNNLEDTETQQGEKNTFKEPIISKNRKRLPKLKTITKRETSGRQKGKKMEYRKDVQHLNKSFVK